MACQHLAASFGLVPRLAKCENFFLARPAPVTLPLQKNYVPCMYLVFLAEIPGAMETLPYLP